MVCAVVHSIGSLKYPAPINLANQPLNIASTTDQVSGGQLPLASSFKS